MYDILIVFVEPVVALVDSWCHSVVSADTVSYLLIFLGVLLIEDDEDQIEARKEGVCHSDVLGRGELRLVLAVNGIGSGYDGAAGVQRAVHACFGDSHRLLLHDLVDGHSVDLVHLVELVDADHAAVSQDHRTCLERLLSRVFVRNHSGSQADTTGSTASRTHSQLGRRHHPA